LMGFSRDVIHHRTDELDELGVRVRWAGRRPRLWRSVIKELEVAEERTKDNDVLNLAMCINYGGRAEVGDAAREIARLAAAGKINPEKVDERTVAKYLYQPDMPDVDLFIRPSGEQRTSNFMLWQSAHSEFWFCEAYWPEFRRTDFLRALRDYAVRHRRFGS
ncbi:di-trans,poly-cis-decaprenylcistransferase, partial [Saccharothrix sp. MB29]|nr:di-trans,poly-cis-decaprenylcistransferase [Saccharothrix sp. MB29]